MIMIKIKPDDEIGIDEKDIAIIYKYGIILLDGSEYHFPKWWIKKYINSHDLYHLYHSDICS